MAQSPKQNTLNKSTLLNWLENAPQDVAIEELSQLIESKTNGEYIIVKKINEGQKVSY